jgi:hypothetical protein
MFQKFKLVGSAGYFPLGTRSFGFADRVHASGTCSRGEPHGVVEVVRVAPGRSRCDTSGKVSRICKAKQFKSDLWVSEPRVVAPTGGGLRPALEVVGSIKVVPFPVRCIEHMVT